MVKFNSDSKTMLLEKNSKVDCKIAKADILEVFYKERTLGGYERRPMDQFI